MPYTPSRTKLDRYLKDPDRRKRLFKILFWARIYAVVAMTIGMVFFFLWIGGII